MSSHEYRVRLDAFEGPLDLLLYLIRRAEVDITDIPIAGITDQYISHLSEIERIDIENAGEFLVMAATLMEIKSRMLMPTEAQRESAGGDLTDPRDDLVRQLLEYKRFRDAAETLDDRRREWALRFETSKASIDRSELAKVIEEEDIEPDDIELIDLVEAFARIIETVNFDRLGDHEVVVDETPIELHAEDIVDRLRRDTDGRGEMGFDAIFSGRSRGEMIGLFLALLELVKQQRVGVAQQDEGNRIVVKLMDVPDEGPMLDGVTAIHRAD